MGSTERGVPDGLALGRRPRPHAYFEQVRNRLRWKLLVAYVTPFVVLSAYFHFHYTQSTRASIHNHLKSVAENHRNTVDLFLQERVANMRNVFRPHLITARAGPDTMEQVLERLRSESATFVDVGLFDPDGTLVSYAGPHPSLQGKDYSSESWFRILVDGKREAIISDVYLGFRGKPHFIIAVARRHVGRTWALRASVDPERFAEFVHRSHLIEQAEALIVNPAGQRQTLLQERAAEEETLPVPPRTPEPVVEELDDGDDPEVV